MILPVYETVAKILKKKRNKLKYEVFEKSIKISKKNDGLCLLSLDPMQNSRVNLHCTRVKAPFLCCL